jgi:elongation factor P--beta-lysine ligase
LEIKVYEGDDWQAIFELIFANKIELELDNSTPYFLYDYPRIMCPLTKVKNGDELVSEKVELYIAGRELGNGYTELTDWQEQERRFKGEQEARMELGKKSVKHDQDLVDALKLGMPEVAGMGMGLDRLVMILANAKSISEINYFPPSEWDN